jgi:hypothetical protein
MCLPNGVSCDKRRRFPSWCGTAAVWLNFAHQDFTIGFQYGNVIWLPGVFTPVSWTTQKQPHGSKTQYTIAYCAVYPVYWTVLCEYVTHEGPPCVRGTNDGQPNWTNTNSSRTTCVPRPNGNLLLETRVELRQPRWPERKRLLLLWPAQYSQYC